MPSPPSTSHRAIRSFVLRQSHYSTAQSQAYTKGMPHWGVSYSPTPYDLNTLFERQAPRILEIGFGMGTATAEIAATRPDNDFLAIEVHTPGVGSLLKLIAEKQLTNVRVVHHDAVAFLTDSLAATSLDGFHLYFPDPWPKKRHHKRRLVQPPFMDLMVSRLKTGAYLHLATDWEDYAVQMLDVLSAHPLLKNSVVGNYAPRPDWRPLTKFEQRGLKLGHGVWDLLFHVVR